MVKKEYNPIKELEERIPKFVISAFSLVAALAWNDAIKDLINSYVTTPESGHRYRFLYAFIATIILIIVIGVVVFLDHKFKQVKNAIVEKLSNNPELVVRFNHKLSGEIRINKDYRMKIKLSGFKPNKQFVFLIDQQPVALIPSDDKGNIESNLIIPKKLRSDISIIDIYTYPKNKHLESKLI